MCRAFLWAHYGMSPQVYNTMCRVFPRRFVLPLSVVTETPCGIDLNEQSDSTATAIKISNNKVRGC